MCTRFKLKTSSFALFDSGHFIDTGVLSKGASRFETVSNLTALKRTKLGKDKDRNRNDFLCTSLHANKDRIAHIFLCRIYLDALLILKMQARAEIAF